LREADAHLDEASDRMLVARQQRQAVENLLHHQQSAYDASVRLEEQKILDDLVGRRLPIIHAGGSLQRPFLN
jgi:flagellar export protein FliJ